MNDTVREYFKSRGLEAEWLEIALRKARAEDRAKEVLVDTDLPLVGREIDGYTVTESECYVGYLNNLQDAMRVYVSQCVRLLNETGA